MILTLNDKREISQIIASLLMKITSESTVKLIASANVATQ